MGCDIHMHLEVKIAGKWEHYGAPSVSRDYSLFGLLAGVRGKGPAVVAPKGFPADASTVTRFDYEQWAGDAHTPSWLSAEEISEFQDAWALAGEHTIYDGRPYPARGRDVEADVLHAYFFGNSWADFARWPEERPNGIEDVRWVFWFDN